MYPLLSSCETVDQVDQRLQIACLKFVRFCVMVSRANARVTHIYNDIWELSCDRVENASTS